LHDIGDVGPCEREVLERPCHASIPGRVREKIPFGVRHLGTNVGRRHRGVAVAHPGSIKHLLGIFSLGKEESSVVVFNINAKKEPQRTHVLDGDDVLK
jgi:hypothetical protein